MIRFPVLLCAVASLLWCQAEGRYHYASMAMKPGPVFEASVRSGVVQIGKQPAARFKLDHPGTPGKALELVSSLNGNLVAGAPAAGGPELFVAIKAPEPGQEVRTAMGEWSAVVLSLEGGKVRGLRTAFVDFTVGLIGAVSNVSAASHEGSVDDVTHSDKPELKLSQGSLELFGIKHTLSMSAAGDMFLATTAPPAAPSLIIGARRDREASTMAIRGSYALFEIGARNTFAFAPDQAKLFSTAGTLVTNGGQARLSQNVTHATGTTQFRGSAAYMVGAGGAGTFSPRLEQQRRNLMVADGGNILLTAQVAEAGKLSLLHGIGVGIRVMEMSTPVVAPRAVVQGGDVSLYGQNLEGTQVILGGQPAPATQTWPNQINIKLASPPASPFSVELDWQGGRTAAVQVAGAATPPEFAAAPAAPGGLIAPAQPVIAGDTIELGITGGTPPQGFMLLFDGIPGSVASTKLVSGATQAKVTLPKNLNPSPQVSVALSTPGHYVDLGDIAVSRPRETSSK